MGVGEQTVDAQDESVRGDRRSGLYDEVSGGMVVKEDGAKVAVVVGDAAHRNGGGPMFAGHWGSLGDRGEGVRASATVGNP